MGQRVLAPPAAQFGTPVLGTLKGLGITNIPPTGLYDSSNAIFRDGTLQGRPGLTQFSTTILGRVMGARHHWTTAGLGRIVAGALTKVWTYSFATTTWSDRGGTLTGTADDPFRVAELVFGTPLETNVIVCNGKEVKQWKDGDASVSAVTGTPPTFKDVAPAADRIIGLVDAYTVRWGESLVLNNWPALNVKQLAETPGRTVGILNLGTLGVIIYKRDSIWLAEATGRGGANEFRFSFVIPIEGPAGPNAIVDAGIWGHIFMTPSGRIGRFNGAAVRWMADGVWPDIRDEIDRTKAIRVNGVYFPAFEEVWFSYPRSTPNDAGECLGLVVVTLPAAQLGREFPAAWRGVWGKAISAGVTIPHEDLSVPLLFNSTSATERSNKITGTNDDGTAYNGVLQTGLQVVTQLESQRLDAIEPFLERASGNGSATLKAVSSHILDKTGGTISAGVTVDLTKTPVKAHEGFDVLGRWMGLRLEWTSAATIRYRGGNIHVGARP